MSTPFQHSAELMRLGVEHGFGMSGSEAAAPADLNRVTQIHGDDIAEVPGATPRTRADGLVTREAGVAVGIQTADCVPILFTTTSCAFVAAVHAGWRGTALEIARKAVAHLVETRGVATSDIVAVIGPHAGPCCYEVDVPVRAAFHDPGDAFCDLGDTGRAGHFMLDLHELNRAQLITAGVPAAAISRVGGCTICDPIGYPSHRRDPDSGRMIHFIRRPAA